MAATSRVLILLDDGSGRGCDGRYFVNIRVSFFLCLDGAATRASTADGAIAGTRGDVRRGSVEGSDNARAAMLANKPAWSKSALFLELYWRGQP